MEGLHSNHSYKFLFSIEDLVNKFAFEIEVYELWYYISRQIR